MAATYGDGGNRWWVGLNVGSDQSTILGVSSILSPVGYESLPSGNAADDAKFAAAAKKDAVSPSSPVTISVENVSWFNIHGPYPTQKAADAALPAIAKANPAPGELSQLYDAATSKPQSNNVAGLANLIGELTSSGTWIRVAKVIIGGVLVIVGVAKLTGAGKVIEDVVK